jgi:hypothetical protein
LSSYILPIAVFILLRKKVGHEARLTTIVIYCLATFALLFVYKYLPKGTIRKIHWSVYTFVEYVSFAFVFWQSTISKKFKTFILILSVGFIFFQVLYFLTSTLSSQHVNLDSVAIGIETILIFIYSFYYLYQEFRNPNNASIVMNPMFWIVCGIIFYLGGSFFFNILANHLSQEVLDDYWYYSYSFDIIKNILFAVAVLFFAKASGKKIKDHLPYLGIDQIDIDQMAKHN